MKMGIPRRKPNQGREQLKRQGKGTKPCEEMEKEEEFHNLCSRAGNSEGDFRPAVQCWGRVYMEARLH